MFFSEIQMMKDFYKKKTFFMNEFYKIWAKFENSNTHYVKNALDAKKQIEKIRVKVS